MGTTEICEAIGQFYGKDMPIAAAWVAGSGTMVLDQRGVTGIPEVLTCAGPKTLIGHFENVQTPFGRVPKVTVMDIDGYPVLRVRYHGWHFPTPTIEDTVVTFAFLHALGVTQVVTDASVGGITTETWDMVIPDDTIVNDDAKTRVTRLTHSLPRTDPWVRMAHPFCDRIGDLLETQVMRLKEEGTEEPSHPLGKLYRGGVYYSMPLNPFETPAEIKHIQSLGANIVGQSSGQEAIASRLCDICFAVINPVANRAEGLDQGAWTQGMTMLEFYQALALPMAHIMFQTLRDMVQHFKAGNRSCPCQGMYANADLQQISRNF